MKGIEKEDDELIIRQEDNKNEYFIFVWVIYCYEDKLACLFLCLYA